MQRLNLDLMPGAEPPTEFRIFRAGQNETSKGTFTFTGDSQADVLAAFAEHGQDQLPIDFDHGMVSGPGTADSGKAAGWFTLDIRNGELWAVNVQWTPAAADMLRNREFRFISPAFLTDASGRITRLINVAITNLPATKNLVPLVAHEAPSDGVEKTNTQEKSTMSEALLKVLGADSDSEAIVIATEHSKWTQQVLSAVEAKSLDEALANIASAKAAAAEVVQLAAKVAELEAAKKESDRERLIAELADAGKLPPSLHAACRNLPEDKIREIANALPSFAEPAATQPDDQIVLSEDDRWVAKQLMIEPAALAETYKLEKEAK